MKHAEDVVGEDFDYALDHMTSVIESIQRSLSAILMMQYPDQGFLEAAAQELRRAVGSEAVEVNVITDDTQVTIVADPTGAQVRKTIPSEDSLCVLVVGTEEPLSVDNLQDNVLTQDRKAADDWSAWAAAPVSVQGACAGTVCALESTPRQWNDEDEGKLLLAAGVIGRAVDQWVEEGKGNDNGHVEGGSTETPG